MKKNYCPAVQDLICFAGKLLIAILLLTSTVTAHAQQKQITGQLKSTSGEAIADASVLLTNNQGLVLKFCTSDVNGKYLLMLPDSANIGSLLVEVNHLSYKKIRQPLTEGRSVYNFALEKKVAELTEVKVHSRPLIERTGDTLSFNVASFSKPEDRTIGDVLKHMPGISVSEKGEISYNGQPIANLYIHGDDLMDGRYTLAPKAISKDMIKNVEVIKNFQPIKMLKNKVPSDLVAMNLVLKNENSLKLSGQAMLGAGLPHQYDAALNTMMFNKKFKMLNVVKANNSGIDYNDDLIQAGANTFLSNMDNSRPDPLLSSGTVSAPNLPRKNYYLNRSGSINANNLVNTKNEWQLRSNIQAFADRNTLNYNSIVNTYLSGDTICYNEDQDLVSKPWLVNTSLTATANKDHYYLNDNLRFNISGNNNNSYMNFNGNMFAQQLQEHNYDLSNLLDWKPGIKNKGFMEVKWYVNYYNSPQNLYVGTGLNSDILNEGKPYLAADQSAKTPTFFSNAMVSYNILNNGFRRAFEAGMINERQTLLSALYLTQTDNTVTDYKGDAGNDLYWHRDRVYFSSSIEIKKKKWNAGVAVPLLWQSINYYQNAYSLDNKQNRFFLNPVAQFRFFPNAEDALSIKYSYKNNMGNISGIYRGAILATYRSLNANDADLQEQNTSGTGIKYSFQRSVLMLFANAGINYNKITSNTIRSSILTNNVQRTVLLPYENDQSAISANADISKYLFILKTTASLRTTFTRSYYNQFINNEKLPYTNDAFTLTAGIDTRLFKVVNCNYTGTGIWTAGRERDKDGAAASKVQRFDQNITVTYTLFKDLFLNLKGRHLYSTQANTADISYFFMDANVRYKMVKWHTDLEFDITNLANVKDYKTFQLNANQFSVNSYQLRGRMAILRATFNL